ncbi:MAG: Mur ligase family protein, partial [bacterium]
MADEYTFRPEFSIPMRSFMDFENMDDAALHELVFHIGMVELISYWKAACSPELRILPFKLSKAQENWWKKLYFNGLGEFFYVNGIEVAFDDFMHLTSSGKPLEPFDLSFANEDVLVPVGGGKDSVVTLEVLRKEGKSLIPMILNPREASIRTIENAGFKLEECAVVYRSLDKLLLDLNERGFLNGHTPFSALLAFVNILLAAASRTPFIALSNESSASESTIPGTGINHQYSKSYEFEQDFNTYVREFLHPGLRYFSFLRPVNELQIARMFSEYPEHFHSFRSCNVGSKTDSWCGKCPKCLFTFIMLSPFVHREVLSGIFNNDLYLDQSLTPVFDELAGIARVKPFECVGTPDEVKAALWKFAETHSKADWPPLIRYFKDHYHDSFGGEFMQLLAQYERDHFIPEPFEKLIQTNVDRISGSGFKDYLAKRFDSKKILILGFGKEGKSTFRYLAENLPDLHPDVADADPAVRESEILRQVDTDKLHLGEHYLDVIGDYDMIIKSPGVKADVDRPGKSVEWNSQTELALGYFRQRVIGVTGTKGKSTTASLIFHMLTANNLPALLIGNIGVPAFDMIPLITEETIIVYEMSAHQLEYLHTSPHVSVLLNVFPEHLDYFGDVDHYTKAKKQIFTHQEKQDFLVVHEDFQKLTGNAVSTVITFGTGEEVHAQLREEALYLRESDSHIERD